LKSEPKKDPVKNADKPSNDSEAPKKVEKENE